MSTERIFGTDGVRGRAGEGWLSVPAVTALGCALGDVLGAPPPAKAGGAGRTASTGAARPRALLGHDGRRSGPELEAALARGLASRGFETRSVGLITTPGLALITRLRGFALGAMISASHNPAEDNGIKVFSSAGAKLPDDVEIAIENALRLRPAVELAGPGPAHDPELELAYLAHLLAGLEANSAPGVAASPLAKPATVLNLEELRIVLDCANGGGSRIGPRVLGRLGARVTAIAAEPDGDNINLRCGATQTALLQQEVRAHAAHVGIALDGDGDRCILVDEKGEVVNGDGIMTLLALHMKRGGELEDPRIVATVMSNRGLHRALREAGIGVVSTDVGDRRVVEALQREKLKLGGEQSGHIVFGPDHFWIGDGIYTALRVLRVMTETKKPISELAAPCRPFPQILLNVPVARKPRWAELPRVEAAQKRVEKELGEDGRVLLRYSGTEPLARVMVEGPDIDRIRAQAQEIAGLIAGEIGK